jgi:hypothetical protein
MVRARNPQDLGAAAMLIVIGLGGLWFGREYELGRAAQMGPGYMPMLLSVALIGFGATIGIRALAVAGPSIERGRWRPVLLVLAAIVAFGLLIASAGLAPATFVVAVLCAFAAQDVSWKEALLLAFGLAAFCAVLFVYALNQPIPVFGAQ